MINRVTRILTRWLVSHPDYGMRPLLDAVSFDSTEEAVRLLVETASLPLTIYNDVDDESVAKRYDPDKVPALVIVADLTSQSPVVSGRGQLDYDTVNVGFSYMERDQPVNNARQRGGYVITALTDALLAFNQPKLARVPIPTLSPVALYAAESATWRELGDVKITEVVSLRESRVTGGVGKSTLIGTLLGTFKVSRTVPARY